MTINELIKSAAKDETLRAELVDEPIRTCNELGVAVDISLLVKLGLPLFTESTVMRVGYRP